jgi:hypothetical protein
MDGGVMIVVVSTGLSANTKQRCIDSVKSQKGASFEHVYIEAGDQNPRLCQPENVYNVVSNLAKDVICVALDGDDYLAHDHVLERVQKMHDDGAWVTYGSFEYADGRPGFARKYATTNYRQEEWAATHLKSWRAALYHRIQLADLKDTGGAWMDRAQDLALMFPLLEMAGSRVTFCSEVLYVYNLANSMEFNAPSADRERERKNAALIRLRPVYERVESL